MCSSRWKLWCPGLVAVGANQYKRVKDAEMKLKWPEREKSRRARASWALSPGLLVGSLVVASLASHRCRGLTFSNNERAKYRRELWSEQTRARASRLRELVHRCTYICIYVFVYLYIYIYPATQRGKSAEASTEQKHFLMFVLSLVDVQRSK